MTDSTIQPQQLDRETVPSFARWVESAYQVVETAKRPLAQLPGEQGEQVVEESEPAATVEEIRRRLVELSQLSGEAVVEAVPVADPQRVREISSTILSCYEVRGGHSELSGCSLEPRPFLRLTFPDAAPNQLAHLWFGDDGSRLDDRLASKLHFDRLEPIAPRLRSGDVGMVQRWIAAAWDTLASSPKAAAKCNRETLVGGTIAWCRRASGKVALVFESGAIGYVAFDGWAAEFLAGDARPTPFRCPYTGKESYRVIALDDGRVTVPEATARCTHSGREVLESELALCEETGQRALPEYMTRCAVSGRRVLDEVSELCDWCQRKVAPDELVDRLCRDCRDRQPVSDEHSMLKQILQRHPEYRRYGSWTGWADDEVGVFVGRRRLREVVVVGEGASGQLLRHGRRWRLGGTWHMATP